ncbi:MAG: hypothetical protein Q9184_007770 [Pyrenodesmia sp. 2 TL-2023]
MRASFLISACFAAAALAQNCGPAFGNQSQYGWATTTTPSNPYASQVPSIDVCGSAQGGVKCPGAGSNGYFYRCCSSAGHCGPKNDVRLLCFSPPNSVNIRILTCLSFLQIQDQAIYCGTGCQAGYGDCSLTQKPPTSPVTAPKIANAGDTCGPIVNAKCAAGLCCSGSNFCGTGPDFCGAANWCQPKWGVCSGTRKF